MHRPFLRSALLLSLAVCAQGLLVAACAVDAPQVLDAPAAEPLDTPFPPDCCLHPGTQHCGDCIEGSYCDACRCWAPMAPISREMCHYNPPECPLPDPPPKHECPTISAWAKDPVTGLCCYYNRSCAAPTGWPQFYNFADCAQ